MVRGVLLSGPHAVGKRSMLGAIERTHPGLMKVFEHIRHPVDIEGVRMIVDAHPAVGVMIVPSDVGGRLSNDPQIKSLDIRTVFLSPMSGDEAIRINLRQSHMELRKKVEVLNYHSVEHEMFKIKGSFSSSDRAEIDRLAKEGVADMKFAHLFHFYILCRCSSMRMRWMSNPTSGETGQTMSDFVTILRGGIPDNVGKWPAGLFD